MTLLEGVMWLALNLYHEGRGESQKGQMAIVHVVLNRAEERNMTIKEVVLEPRQFSWTLKPKRKWKPKNTKAYKNCVAMVKKAMNSKDFTKGAMYFHSKKIKPRWSRSKRYVATYGNHKFYKEKS